MKIYFNKIWCRVYILYRILDGTKLYKFYELFYGDWDGTQVSFSSVESKFFMPVD
jgi:hypothetical protein